MEEAAVPVTSHNALLVLREVNDVTDSNVHRGLWKNPIVVSALELCFGYGLGENHSDPVPVFVAQHDGAVLVWTLGTVQIHQLHRFSVHRHRCLPPASRSRRASATRG